MKRILLFAVVTLIANSVFAGDIQCPDGASVNREISDEVTEAWCEVDLADVVVQHGPYRAWFLNGKVAAEGQYEKGKPVGVWKNWYDNGTKQSEETYNKGNKVSAEYWDYKGKPIKLTDGSH